MLAAAPARAEDDPADRAGSGAHAQGGADADSAEAAEASVPEAGASAPPRSPDATSDLADLSIEELLAIETTSVAKMSLTVALAPAAVHVITDTDLRRTGVRSIPEALRFSPGVQVARADSSRWATGVRGFGDTASRAVLVNIDGRNTYSPLFAAVFWDAQQVFLADVDRIEVIRGPGGALWGANAMNGVVDVITKPARDTQGALAVAGAGTEEVGFVGARWGGQAAEDIHYRVYGQYQARDAFHHDELADFDDWRTGQAGFRVDWEPSADDLLTLSGDAYAGALGRRTVVNSFTPPVRSFVERDDRIAGGNVLASWRRSLGDRSDVQVRAYYDRTERRTPTFREDRDTADVEARWRFALPLGQDIVVGAGYRVTVGDTRSLPTADFQPNARTDQIFNVFIQDQIELWDDTLWLTLGAKLEHNDYTGFEVHPSARLAFQPVSGHLLWVAVSRAVRTPSRFEHDLTLSVPADDAGTLFGRFLGDGDFRSERLTSFEGGYRGILAPWLSIDVAGFYNRYEELLSLEVGAAFVESDPPPDRLVLPFFFRNRLHGYTYGVEVGATIEPLEGWRLRGAYSFVVIDLDQDSGGLDNFTEEADEGGTPRNQALGRSSFDLPHDLELDVIVRYVDRLPAQDIRSYITADARLAWRPQPHLEVAIVGQNLVDSHHAELERDSEVERGAYVSVEWRW